MLDRTLLTCGKLSVCSLQAVQQVPVYGQVERAVQEPQPCTVPRVRCQVYTSLQQVLLDVLRQDLCLQLHHCSTFQGQTYLRSETLLTAQGQTVSRRRVQEHYPRSKVSHSLTLRNRNTADGPRSTTHLCL